MWFLKEDSCNFTQLYKITGSCSYLEFQNGTKIANIVEYNPSKISDKFVSI